MYRKTITVAEAQELAKAQSIPGLEEAIAQALAASWDAMTIIAEENEQGTYDITMEAPTGVVVAWFLPAHLARAISFPGGELASDLHVTLAYLGDVAGLSLDDQRKLVGVVGEVVVRWQSMSGYLAGSGLFEPEDGVKPFWIGVDVPGLADLHTAIVNACREAGIGAELHENFQPHVTVAYLPEDAETPAVDFGRVQVHVDSVTIAVGPQRLTLSFPEGEVDEYPESESLWQPMTKAVDVETPERYTLAPMYVPDQLDAHGDWSDSKELQKAVWDYTRAKEFDIRLQHNIDIVAGECVELLCWPYEVTVPLTKADGTTVDYTYPPGTPFMGVIWEEWAWPLIEEGKLNGYSIGGKADMIEVDLGAEALQKAKDYEEQD